LSLPAPGHGPGLELSNVDAARIACPTPGVSGYRTLVATNRGKRWVFVFGFPKNERGNIDKDESEALTK
jgi:hypothetical protein